MKHPPRPPFVWVVFSILLSGIPPAAPAREGAPPARPIPVEISAGSGYRSTAPADPNRRAKAAPDTFWIYGGPGSDQGRFETNAIPDWQGWTTEDLTDKISHWQVSDYNASNLGGHGAGNHAAWCGRSAAQEPGWATAPGYGNSWNDQIVFESPPLVDPSIAQTVQLDFFFNHDSEQAYDFFWVAYDSASTGGALQRSAGYPGSRVVLETTGRSSDASGNFLPPGESFTTVATGQIRYSGNDYGGPGENRIRIRLWFTSDGAFSDEDGLWPTDGAVQVDDILVQWDDGTGTIQTAFEDFEGADPLGTGPWRPWKPPFAGDFTSILPGLTDLDPCRADPTTVLSFIDYGQTIRNAASASLPPGAPTSTGGSLSPTWSYGLPGGWVVNYSGGVSLGLVGIDMAAVSPVIDLDLPGTADDAPEIRGLILALDEYAHNPLIDGLFWQWEMRSRPLGGAWSEWNSHYFVYFSNEPAWLHLRIDLTEVLEPDAQQVQVRLRESDLAGLFWYPGNDATPAPYFDNVGLAKVRIPGPVIFVEEPDLVQSRFPRSGTVDASTQAARDALDIPFDVARNISFGGLYDAGDSVVATIKALLPGTTVADARMLWVLDRNPLFDSVRTPPAGRFLSTGAPKDVNVDTTSDPLRWSGEVLGDVVHDQGGALRPDEFFFDLPDVDFLYPGDVLRWAVQATDSDGRVQTLPEDLSTLPTGGSDGVYYSEAFTVRGLPSLQDSIGSMPEILVVDLSGTEAERTLLSTTLRQMYLRPGLEYDLFREHAPNARHGAGIGNREGWGATAAQLEGYRTILLHAGSTGNGLSDGSQTPPNDRSDDLSLLRAWHDRPGEHLGVYIGGRMVENLERTPDGVSFARQVLALQPGPPLSVPVSGGGFGIWGSSAFAGSFSGYELATGCGEPTDLTVGHQTKFRVSEWETPFALVPIQVFPAGLALLEYVDFTGVSVGTAAIIHDRVSTVTGDRQRDVTLPWPLSRVGSSLATGLPGRVRLLREVLQAMGQHLPDPNDAPPSIAAARLEIAPNPFNPRTRIQWSVPHTGRAVVRVYDLRGRAIRELFRGEVEAGDVRTLVFDGRDDRGVALASGVYVVAVDAKDHRARRKLVLIE